MSPAGLPSAGLPSAGQPSNLKRPSPSEPADYARQIRLGAAGACPRRPTHLIATIDSSASVYSGVDPIGMRFVELEAAIRAVGRRCRCDDELVSILHFDHPVQNDVIAANLRDKHAILPGLKAPRDGAGCSLLGPSLATARRLALAHPAHRNVLIALTDFMLFDGAQVWQDFEAFPGDVHACVLGGGFSTFGPDVVVTNVDRSDAPGSVAHAVFDAFVAERRTGLTRRAAVARTATDGHVT